MAWLGVKQGSKSEPPKPAVRIGDSVFFWRGEPDGWFQLPAAVADQTFFPEDEVELEGEGYTPVHGEAPKHLWERLKLTLLDGLEAESMFLVFLRDGDGRFYEWSGPPDEVRVEEESAQIDVGPGQGLKFPTGRHKITILTEDLAGDFYDEYEAEE